MRTRFRDKKDHDKNQIQGKVQQSENLTQKNKNNKK